MYSPIRYAGSIFRKKAPIHLTFFVTRRCNSKCPFCFYLKSADSRAGRAEELDLAEIRKVSNSFGNLLWLAFSGGEIFLRDDLAEISSIFYRRNRPAIMLFPTNGLLPGLIKKTSEQILKDCGNSIIAVKLSIDGIDKAHDELRNTPGSFEKTMETYYLLAELLNAYPNFELGVNTVFCAGNQDRMDDIIDFVNSLKKIKTHTISLIRGDLADKRHKDIDYSKYCKAAERLEKNLKNKNSPMYRFRGARIKAAQDILQRRLINQTMIEQRQLIPCYAGKLNLVLTENGEVYPCEILKASLGNIRDYEYDVRRLVVSERARGIINSIKNRECFCTHECYFMTNILFNLRLYPALAKEYIQL